MYCVNSTLARCTNSPKTVVSRNSRVHGPAKLPITWLAGVDVPPAMRCLQNVIPDNPIHNWGQELGSEASNPEVICTVTCRSCTLRVVLDKLECGDLCGKSEQASNDGNVGGGMYEPELVRVHIA